MSESTDRNGRGTDKDGDTIPLKLLPTKLATEQAAIATLVRSTAEQHRGDGMALLRLLRLLEGLHREIREGLFQESLPDNRQALHNLLRDIEAEGGWPYINRMRLQALLVNLLEATSLVSEELMSTDSLEPASSSDGISEPPDSIESVE